MECFMCKLPTDEKMVYLCLSVPMTDDEMAEIHEEDVVSFERGGYELEICQDCARALDGLFSRMIFAPERI